MKFSLKIKILSAAAVLLTAAYVSGVVFSYNNVNKRQSAEKIFDKNNIELIAGIKIDSEDGEIILNKENDKWLITLEGRKYPAPADKIGNLIDTVSKLTKYQLSGADKNSWGKFDLEEDKSRNAFFYDSKGEVLFALHLGKDGPVDSSGEFIRTSLSEEVYLTETSIKTYFIRDINYWSNLRILPLDLDSASIASVKISSNIKLDNASIDLNFHIKKEAAGNAAEWKNMIVDKPVDKNRADLLISNIVSLTGDSFTEEKITKNDSKIEIETEKHGTVIIDGMMLNDEEFIFGIRDSELLYKISMIKIERIFDSINNIYSESN